MVVDEPVKPILFQHLTDLVFQVLLHDHFQILYINQEVSSCRELTKQLIIIIVLVTRHYVFPFCNCGLSCGSMSKKMVHV